jgi:hypothetical protein
MAALHELVAFYAGDTWEICGTLNLNGSPVNLSGASVEWKLADGSGNAILDLTIGSGIAVTDVAGGGVLITVTPSQSAAIKPCRYRDQLRLTTVDGTVATEWTGFIEVKPSLLGPAPSGEGLAFDFGNFGNSCAL